MTHSCVGNNQVNAIQAGYTKTMSSRREAESIIKKIRKSRRANDLGGAGADANARSLSRALDMSDPWTESWSSELKGIDWTSLTLFIAGFPPNCTRRRHISYWN